MVWPSLVRLVGPNPARETTFINGFLGEQTEMSEFVNPAEVAHGLTGIGPTQNPAAGRLVLERPDAVPAPKKRA